MNNVNVHSVQDIHDDSRKKIKRGDRKVTIITRDAGGI